MRRNLSLRTARAVGVRELSRSMRTILREIENDDLHLIVTNAGRPVAMLIPVGRGHDPPTPGPALEALSEEQQRIVGAVARGANAPDTIIEETGIDASRIALELAKLEIKGAIRKMRTGYVLL